MIFITSLPPLTMQITDGGVVFNLLLHLQMVRHSRYLGLWTTACLVPEKQVHVRCYADVKNKVTNSLSPDISWNRLLSPGNVRQ